MEIGGLRYSGVRWLILLILAVASFAGYLLWIHGSADALVRTERDVTERLRALAAEPAREAKEEHGYRYYYRSEYHADVDAQPDEGEAAKQRAGNAQS